MTAKGPHPYYCECHSCHKLDAEMEYRRNTPNTCTRCGDRTMRGNMCRGCMLHPRNDAAYTRHKEREWRADLNG